MTPTEWTATFPDDSTLRVLWFRDTGAYVVDRPTEGRAAEVGEAWESGDPIPRSPHGADATFSPEFTAEYLAATDAVEVIGPPATPHLTPSGLAH